jgi:hypothetical protein
MRRRELRKRLRADLAREEARLLGEDCPDITPALGKPREQAPAELLLHIQLCRWCYASYLLSIGEQVPRPGERPERATPWTPPASRDSSEPPDAGDPLLDWIDDLPGSLLRPATVSAARRPSRLRRPGTWRALLRLFLKILLVLVPAVFLGYRFQIFKEVYTYVASQEIEKLSVRIEQKTRVIVEAKGLVLDTLDFPDVTVNLADTLGEHYVMVGLGQSGDGSKAYKEHIRSEGVIESEGGFVVFRRQGFSFEPAPTVSSGPGPGNPYDEDVFGAFANTCVQSVPRVAIGSGTPKLLVPFNGLENGQAFLKVYDPDREFAVLAECYQDGHINHVAPLQLDRPYVFLAGCLNETEIVAEFAPPGVELPYLPFVACLDLQAAIEHHARTGEACNLAEHTKWYYAFPWLSPLLKGWTNFRPPPAHARVPVFKAFMDRRQVIYSFELDPTGDVVALTQTIRPDAVIEYPQWRDSYLEISLRDGNYEWTRRTLKAGSPGGTRRP